MSGVKRRSKYRKNVTQDVLYNFPEPTENQCIGQIQRSLGSNLLQIQYLNTINNTIEEGIARLPTKFRKLVWVKRGDYIIASVAEGDIETSAGVDGKVKYTVEHILYSDQIKHLQKMNKWPNHFSSTTMNSNGGFNGSSNEGEEILIHVANLDIRTDNSSSSSRNNNSSSSSSSSTSVIDRTIVRHIPRSDDTSSSSSEEDNDSSEESEEQEMNGNGIQNGKEKNNRKPVIRFGRPGELPPSYSDEEDYEEE